MNIRIGAILLLFFLAFSAHAQTLSPRQEAVDRFKAQREQAKQELRSKRAEFQNMVKSKKEEVKSQIEAKQATLKERLQRVKDEKKKQAVERLYSSINELNARMADHFANVLNQIEDVLDRVKSRAGKAEANGLDVLLARTAITAAEIAIASARDEVKTQAGKIYTIEVQSEQTLKSDAGTSRQALHNDLSLLKEKVKAARDAVKQAAVALAQIPRVNEAEVP
ncbi:MAG: hypothetical protein HYS52_01175 [Candidatus Wildermuthbacteria bacterium]|nr:hypothetical protein [Candidatus Wildermuthbacteria bacterium]